MTRSTSRWIPLLALAPIALLSVGCVPEIAAISGGIGFFLGRATAPTVTTQECFVNGQVVDCSAVH